jgi:beta-glucosidase-like glycosyl hydrolase
MALEAGADLLCLSNNGSNGYDPDIVPKVVKIIKKLVADGTVDSNRIILSAQRIRKLKERLSTTVR